jgi:hypothetical protein
MRLPTTPATVISSPAVAAVTLVSDTGTTQQWSVVISVSERPYQSAAPHTTFYRLPVLYSSYGVRGTALPDPALTRPWATQTPWPPTAPPSPPWRDSSPAT